MRGERIAGRRGSTVRAHGLGRGGVRPVLRRRSWPTRTRSTASCAASPGGAASPEYDAFGVARLRRRVAACSADRERFSIVEGPVFHREALLRHNDGRTRHDRSRRPVRSFSMLDPPRAHALAPGDARSVPARVPSPGGGHGPAVRRARSSTSSSSAASSTCATTTRRRSRPQVAALQLGVPRRGRRAARRRWVNAFVRASPTSPGSARRAGGATSRLHDYLVDLVAERRRHRGPTGHAILIDSSCDHARFRR